MCQDVVCVCGSSCVHVCVFTFVCERAVCKRRVCSRLCVQELCVCARLCVKEACVCMCVCVCLCVCLSKCVRVYLNVCSKCLCGNVYVQVTATNAMPATQNER